jgi:hypothetical protein
LFMVCLPPDPRGVRAAPWFDAGKSRAAHGLRERPPV